MKHRNTALRIGVLNLLTTVASAASLTKKIDALRHATTRLIVATLVALSLTSVAASAAPTGGSSGGNHPIHPSIRKCLSKDGYKNPYLGAGCSVKLGSIFFSPH